MKLLREAIFQNNLDSCFPTSFDQVIKYKHKFNFSGILWLSLLEKNKISRKNLSCKIINHKVLDRIYEED